MEGLRLLPVFMFLSGILLVYAGFKNMTPVEVMRGSIRDFQDWDDSDQGYGMSDNPFYGGVPLYSNPGYRSGPSTF